MSASSPKKNNFLPEIGRKSSASSSGNGSRPTSSSGKSKNQVGKLSPGEKPLKRDFSTVKSADLLRAKKYEKQGISKEDLAKQLKEVAAKLKELKQYDNEEAKTIQETVARSAWDYMDLRKENSTLLIKEGYVVTSVKMLKTLNEIGIFKSDQIWFPTYYTYNALLNYSEACQDFSTALAEAGVMSLLMANCSHKPYLDAMDSPNVLYVLRASLTLLANIARFHAVRYLFKDYNIKLIVMPFCQSGDEFFKTTSLILICFLAEEKNILAFNKETDVINLLCERLGKALDDETGTYYTITPYQIAAAIVTLSSYDETKQLILEAGAVDHFVRMLGSTVMADVKIGMEGLWSLSFNKDAKKAMHENKNIMTMMSKMETHDDKEFRRLMSGAKYQMQEPDCSPINNITGNTDDTAQVVAADDTTISAPTGHVFISYSWVNQKTVLQISNSLKASGYKVWIDVDQITGDTLEAMAGAVEQAAVVLICVSGAYKESSNARTEAEYTFSIKKPYIPCIMERKYKADGWLGALVGSKIYVDFTQKEPFEKTMAALRKEIGDRGKEVTDTNKPASALPRDLKSRQSRQGPTEQLDDWTKAQVQKWLIKKGLHRCTEAMADFDGRLLDRLSKMRGEAVDFYYKSLDKKFGWSVVDILNFTEALDELHFN